MLVEIRQATDTTRCIFSAQDLPVSHLIAFIDAGKALLALKTLGRDPAASRIISSRDVRVSKLLEVTLLIFEFVEPHSVA